MVGPISPDVTQMGARSAGNPHAACDVEGAGNVARSGCLGRLARQSSTLPGKAVFRSLIAPQVAREFFPLEAVSSPWPVDQRAKDPSLALGQACPGSEQEGPARVAQGPHERRSDARGGGAGGPRGETRGGP